MKQWVAKIVMIFGVVGCAVTAPAFAQSSVGGPTKQSPVGGPVKQTSPVVPESKVGSTSASSGARVNCSPGPCAAIRAKK